MTLKLVVSLISIAAVLLSALPARAQQAEVRSYDVVVYGGTASAVVAAIAADRMGLSVALVSPDTHLGGLTSSGLGWTDSKNGYAIGGLAREFYHRIWKYYTNPAAWKRVTREEYARRVFAQPGTTVDDQRQVMWTFEPHVAERVFDQWLAETRVDVHRDEWLDRATGVDVADQRIQRIRTLSGRTYEARVFIDATYEGDLMAAAGVSYHVGRESNDTYGETLNGVQTRRAISHQFEYPVDPYVVEGDPSSGLLPRISPDPPGVDGEGDHRIQAYCFRVCLTTAKDNQVPFPKPEGYDPNQYALLARYLKGGWKGVFNKFDPAPNGKTDTNNHGAFSTDNIGMNYDYPEASYERRKEIIKEHEIYQKGWFYFLANDPSVPQDIQERMRKWGLAKDEFVDNGNWPHQLYIRESRRMIGPVVMTEPMLRALVPTPKSVGMGSYNMDSHNTQRYVNEQGHVRNEGDIQISPGGPYPISYDSLTPKKDECTNLLVPVCVSASHISYGSIRMEPVFMILGQSAATAAAMAIDEGIAVQDVPYDKLKERLLADGQVLEMERQPRPPKVVLEPEKLDGTVIDDSQAKKEGQWLESHAISGYVGHGYVHDDATGRGEKKIHFTASDLKPGKYEVRVAYSANGNRASNVPVTITSAGKNIHQGEINQKQKPPVEKIFVSLGKFDLSGEVTVTLSNEGVDGHVVADAVQFLPVK